MHSRGVVIFFNRELGQPERQRQGKRHFSEKKNLCYLNYFEMVPIAHFRVALSLLFKPRPSAKPFI